MIDNNVYTSLLKAHRDSRALLFLLVDPDKAAPDELSMFAAYAEKAGVDGFLVGGSLSMVTRFEECITALKEGSSRPVIIFPGGIHQISGAADAILFLSMISGRNAEQLIGQHVVAAPLISELKLEAISTGYMIVESDRVTSTEYMSYSKPIPRDKPEIAAAHALAAEMLGMKFVYLEAGSGAGQSVPEQMISEISSRIDIPIIVGGGITSPQTAASKVEAGASVVVIGNHFEKKAHQEELKDFAEAVHNARDWSLLDT